MTILFDPSYPASLLKALNLVLSIDPKNRIEILAYTKDVDEKSFLNPVIFLFDESKKGIDNQTRLYASAGYRVFAFKQPPAKRRQLFLIALTVLNLFPKALEIMQANTGPFIYTFRYRANKFSKVKL